MSILFRGDWGKYPGAIMDLKTSNKSFLRLAGLYRKMGIKNHTFMLALHNKDLQGVDPHSEDLTDAQKLAIALECKENVWYFFREVFLVPPPSGNKKIQFRANRANIATIWLAMNHVTSYLLQIRQTGKSLTGDGIDAYMLNSRAINANISLVTKDDKLRNKTSIQIREIINHLPPYLQLLGRKDIKNSERVTVKSLGNSINLYVGRNDKKAADNLGRGMTTPIVRIDEFAYIYNIDITLPVMLAATTEASSVARDAGEPYYTLFTTTPGKLSTKEGRFAYDVYRNSVKWSEKFFDLFNEEALHDLVRKNNTKYEVMLLEFNHRQLGFTDQWLADRVKKALSSGESAENDYFLKWVDGGTSSPIPKNILKIIRDSEIKNPNVMISKTGYVINWYLPDHEINRIKKSGLMTIGLDTSDALGEKNDAIGLVIRDASNGATIGAGKYNETNLANFADFLVDILEMFPKSVLIPERRSSATAILDNMFRLMVAKKINPFKRIFNLLVDNYDALNETEKNIVDRMPTVLILEKYKKKFGFATSGGDGSTSRSLLYGNVFKTSLSYTADTVRDPELIRQMTGLIIKNNRIDHEVNEHDDMVVSYMLALWFLIYAKNKKIYGASSNDILKFVMDSELLANNPDVDKDKIRKQDKIRKEIEFLIKKLSGTNNQLIGMKILGAIRKLREKIDTTILRSFNIDSMLEDIKLYRKLKKR